MNDYVTAAMRMAEYDEDSDGSTFGSAQPLPGVSVSASGPSFRACSAALRREVTRVLRAAMLDGQPLPPLSGSRTSSPEQRA